MRRRDGKGVEEVAFCCVLAELASLCGRLNSFSFVCYAKDVFSSESDARRRKFVWPRRQLRFLESASLLAFIASLQRAAEIGGEFGKLSATLGGNDRRRGKRRLRRRGSRERLSSLAVRVSLSLLIRRTHFLHPLQTGLGVSLRCAVYPSAESTLPVSKEWFFALALNSSTLRTRGERPPRGVCAYTAAWTPGRLTRPWIQEFSAKLAGRS